MFQERADEVLASMKGMRTEAARQMSQGPGRHERDIVAGAIGGWPVYPVPVNAHWEYWIYAGVASGIEVTFVQPMHKRPYEYAEAPIGTGKIARIWQDMNPRFVVARAAHRTPNTYRPDFATGPLDFYFYTAAFKGEGGQTALEIYYGIPTRHLQYVAGEGGVQIAYLERGVGVYDEEGQPVYRKRWEMPLLAAEAVDTSAGTFVPEMDRILLPPGNYRLKVQVLDRASGKSQVYPQDRVLPNYGGHGLKLSDIELASSTPVAGKRKFLKGDVVVVPMASRAFGGGRPVAIYFEIYNLKRDEFGATNYRVSYEIRSLEKKSVGARILGGFGKLLGGDERTVVRIEYEQTGTEPDERAYLELDMSNSEPGTQLLKILVTDENQGKSVGATTVFEIGE